MIQQRAIARVKLYGKDAFYRALRQGWMKVDLVRDGLEADKFIQREVDGTLSVPTLIYIDALQGVILGFEGQDSVKLATRRVEDLPITLEVAGFVKDRAQTVPEKVYVYQNVRPNFIVEVDLYGAQTSSDWPLGQLTSSPFVLVTFGPRHQYGLWFTYDAGVRLVRKPPFGDVYVVVKTFDLSAVEGEPSPSRRSVIVLNVDGKLVFSFDGGASWDVYEEYTPIWVDEDQEVFVWSHLSQAVFGIRNVVFRQSGILWRGYNVYNPSESIDYLLRAAGPISGVYETLEELAAESALPCMLREEDWTRTTMEIIGGLPLDDPALPDVLRDAVWADMESRGIGYDGAFDIFSLQSTGNASDIIRSYIAYAVRLKSDGIWTPIVYGVKIEIPPEIKDFDTNDYEEITLDTLDAQLVYDQHPSQDQLSIRVDSHHPLVASVQGETGTYVVTRAEYMHPVKTRPYQAVEIELGVVREDESGSTTYWQTTFQGLIDLRYGISIDENTAVVSFNIVPLATLLADTVNDGTWPNFQYWYDYEVLQFLAEEAGLPSTIVTFVGQPRRLADVFTAAGDAWTANVGASAWDVISRLAEYRWALAYTDGFSIVFDTQYYLKRWQDEPIALWVKYRSKDPFTQLWRYEESLEGVEQYNKIVVIGEKMIGNRRYNIAVADVDREALFNPNSPKYLPQRRAFILRNPAFRTFEALTEVAVKAKHKLFGRTRLVSGVIPLNLSLRPPSVIRVSYPQMGGDMLVKVERVNHDIRPDVANGGTTSFSGSVVALVSDTGEIIEEVW